jgi:hypothetical protein
LFFLVADQLIADFGYPKLKLDTLLTLASEQTGSSSARAASTRRRRCDSGRLSHAGLVADGAGALSGKVRAASRARPLRKVGTQAAVIDVI